MKFLIQDVSPETFGIWTVIDHISSFERGLIFRLITAVTSVSDYHHNRENLLRYRSSNSFAVNVIGLCSFLFKSSYIVDAYIWPEKFKVYSYHYYFQFSEAALYLVYGYLRSLQRSGLLSSLYFLRFGVRSVILMLM